MGAELANPRPPLQPSTSWLVDPSAEQHPLHPKLGRDPGISESLPGSSAPGRNQFFRALLIPSAGRLPLSIPVPLGWDPSINSAPQARSWGLFIAYGGN
jgi:hypothetical protein